MQVKALQVPVSCIGGKKSAILMTLLFRKMIEIPIIEEDSYENNVVMYVVIGEPKHIAGKNC